MIEIRTIGDLMEALEKLQRLQAAAAQAEADIEPVFKPDTDDFHRFAQASQELAAFSDQEIQFAAHTGPYCA